MEAKRLDARNACLYGIKLFGFGFFFALSLLEFIERVAGYTGENSVG